ncbi:MAG: cbb3-type cytochrome c oxidase N-terminal domain-containing protein [Gallionella sp.]|jgi:cytochrome c oxidase cbb3-type subunit 3|nr:cbb3-type cytochrome c oxidase N-terminal domain-containing protein [Gallionella sp.]
MSDNQNSAGGVPTTGHVWDDDLGDLTNQPPRWWMLGLTASAIWVVVYWLMYPSIPFSTSGDFFKGIGLPATGQWTAIKELEQDQAVLDAVRKPFEDKLKDMTPAAILADSELSEYVTRSGKVLFSDNCAACHGQNGVGSDQKDAKFAVRERGLMAPILLDDDWLFGGKIDDIHTSITGGRQGMMMAHKDMLSDAELDTLANAVAAGTPTSTPLFAEKGCTACHGEDGKGVAAMGSANLTDKIWRFDGSVEGIKQTIKFGVNSGDSESRNAVMPNFTEAGKLSAVDMKKLAVYVYKFGGGQAEAVAPVVEAAAVSEVAATAPVAE